MATLKAYSLGNNGFVDWAVIEALGQPRHTRQASVLIFAHTKREAIAVVEAHRQVKATVAVPQYSDPEFRTATGPYAHSLLDAGWITEPAIVVTPMFGGWPEPVVRIGLDGSPEFMGVMRRVAGEVVLSREEMPA